MNPTTLHAEKRSVSSRGELRKLRQNGYVPGVIYGKDVQEPMPITVEFHQVQSMLRSNPHAVLEIDVTGVGKVNVLMNEVQRDAMSRDVMHVDFFKINMNERIKAPVRLEVSGKSAGEQEGGMLQLVLHELEVECLPKDLPEAITLDVQQMQVGDHLTVADMKLPNGVEAVTDPETVVVAVLAPQKERTEEEREAMDDATEEHKSQAESARMVE